VPPRREAGKDQRTAGLEKRPLRVSELGWTRQEAAEARGRLAAFEEDWNAQGMEAYDDVVGGETSSSFAFRTPT
jgi:hypothetical protein